MTAGIAPTTGRGWRRTSIGRSRQQTRGAIRSEGTATHGHSLGLGTAGFDVTDDAPRCPTTGAIVCDEARAYRPTEEVSKAAALEGQVKTSVAKTSPAGSKPVKRTKIAGVPFVALRAPEAILVVSLH